MGADYRNGHQGMCRNGNAECIWGEGARVGKAEVCTVGCVVGTVPAKPWGRKRNIGKREGAHYLCLGGWHERAELWLETKIKQES